MGANLKELQECISNEVYVGFGTSAGSILKTFNFRCSKPLACLLSPIGRQARKDGRDPDASSFKEFLLKDLRTDELFREPSAVQSA